jgi:ABC-type amino acid transport substrate-binding protein
MRRTIALAVLIATLLAAPAEAAGRRLRVGLDGAYPPFSRVTPEGTAEGYDVEVANAVCARLTADCEMVVVGWNDLVPALLARRVDLTVASQPITEEARRRIEFSQPYHWIPPRFVGRLADRRSAPPPAGLAGLTIGVRVGTIHAAWIAAAHREAKAVAFASEAEAVEALLDGRVDLVFGDSLGLYDVLERQRPLGRIGFVGTEVRDPAVFGAGAGIGFRREDRALGLDVDRALGDLARDGTLDRLAGHWFPFAVR